VLLEKIQDEMKHALKNKESERLSVLKLLIAEIKNEAFKEGKKRDESEIVMAYHKRLTKAKDEFGSSNAAYGDKLTFEIDIVEEFLPKLLSEDEIRSQLKELESTGTPIDLKTIMPMFKGKADSRVLQGIVKNWGDAGEAAQQ
jgi:uncharacterized protein YqeY